MELSSPRISVIAVMTLAATALVLATMSNGAYASDCNDSCNTVSGDTNTASASNSNTNYASQSVNLYTKGYSNIDVDQDIDQGACQQAGAAAGSNSENDIDQRVKNSDCS